MIKIFFIIFVSLFSVTLFGCDSEQNNNIPQLEKKEIKEKKDTNLQLNKEKSKLLPFDLFIKGENINIKKSLQLSHVDGDHANINFDFSSKDGENYNFDLKYRRLASNRSYPTNLDITIKNSKDEKLGYLFWATNGIDFLKRMGIFGFIIDIDGKPVDIKFVFDDNKKGDLLVNSLDKERFFQDTLVSKFGFQMIRPVIVPQIKKGLRTITYKLDNHPYSINYTIKDLPNGLVQFQHNLYSTKNNTEHLLERIYFNSDSIQTLREAMYAGKYFHPIDGVFKLVFYPNLGQLEPSNE